MVRVAVASPSRYSRGGLRHIIEQLPGVAVVAELASLRELLDEELDVLVVDSYPSVGTELEQVLGEGQLGLVLLGADGSEQLTSRSLPVRGLALLSREASEDAVRGAVLIVSAGLSLQEERASVAVALQESTLLTPRERQILQLMSEGKANKQIASALDLSIHTVKFHIATLLLKLGAASRTEAVTDGIRRGLVSL